MKEVISRSESKKTQYFPFSFFALMRFFQWKRGIGFMLVELLIVMAVSAILLSVGIALLNPGAQINRSNDAKRKSDLTAIESGLERYFADTGDYPGNVGWCSQISNASNKTVNDALRNYITKVPTDPKYAGTTSDYYYWHSAPREYHLYAVFDNASDPDISSGALAADGGGAAGCTGAAYNIRAGNYTAIAVAYTPTPLPPTSTPTLTPTPTPAAPYVYSTSGSTCNCTTSLQWTHTTAVGELKDLLMVFLTRASSASVTSITANGQALTKHASSASATGAVTELWYLLNPPDGSFTIAVNFSNLAISATAATVNYVNQSTPFNTAGTNTGSGTTLSIASLATASNELILVAGGTTNANTFSAVAGQTLLTQQTLNKGLGLYSKPGVTGTTPVSATWTTSAGTDSIFGISIKE